MTTETTPLTMADNIAEIVRYWDKSAECEEKKRNGQWVAKTYKIDEEPISHPYLLISNP